jgi:hypothetical protein
MNRWLSVAALVLLVPTIQAQELPFVVLSDYPRYATTPPPQHLETLRKIGRALAGAASQADGSTMLQVSVVGHADFDAKGRAFENEVSVDRAKSARDAIVDAFTDAANQMLLDDGKRRLVSFEYSGRGTSEPLFPSSAPMSERVQNRRVVVSWAPVAVIRPTSRAAVDRCASVIATGATTPLRRTRISCACTLLRDNPRAGDDFYSLKLFQEALGPRNARDLSAAELTEVFRRSKHHYRSQMHQASQGTLNDDAAFVKQLERVDYTLIFEIDQVQRQFAVRPLLHDVIINADIGKKSLDSTHVYSCYAGASMQDLDQNR